MKKVEAIIRPEQLQPVQDALDELGVSGLTVTEVMGCGRQKGYTEQYRGSRANISLLPKLKVESVVPNEVVDQAVDAIVGAAWTGEVAGQTLEAANLFALRSKVASSLEMIAPARILPLAYFRAPAIDYSLPVYEDDGEIVSPVISGPNLKARELAGMRQAVCRYLLSAGYVEDESEVTVGVLRPRDLRLVEPAAIFRSQLVPAFWLPTVEGLAAEGPVIGVHAHVASLARP